MGFMALESFEQHSLEIPKFDVTEKMDVLNKCFKTSVKSQDGIFGTTEIIKDNGIVERISRTADGALCKDYFRENSLFKTKIKIGDGEWEQYSYDESGKLVTKEYDLFGNGRTNEIKKFHYDDNGTMYLTEHKIGTEKSSTLAPNTEIVKGNYTCKTDALGRPVYCEVKDVVLKDTGRESLNNIRPDSSYRAGDERGHIIADSLGGPASAENVLPQANKVNHGQFMKVEGKVRDIVQNDSDACVDYGMKINYSDDGMRPSSYEPTIKINGIEEDLDKNLKKIYNEAEVNRLDTMKTNVGEATESIKVKISPTVKASHQAGTKMGKQAAVITCAVSTVDNVSSYMQGDISAEEMVIDIAKDTGTAGAIGYGTGFVSTAVASTMSQSSHQMIRSLGNSGVPAATIAFGISSYDSVMDYAQGNIDEKELAYDLGENAIGVAGSSAGATVGSTVGAAVGGVVGGAVGSVVPGAGTVAGAAIGTNAGSFVGGVAGGMVGYAVATGAYKTAVETGAENAEMLAEKAKTMATNTVEMAKVEIPDAAENIKGAINNFALQNKLPFTV